MLPGAKGEMSKKAVVIGLDCLSPKLAERFAEEGILPNMKRLMDEGAYVKALPCFPAWTPTNWTTIATGAYPGTHGVFAWGTHRPGEADEVTNRKWAMASSSCSAEYIWETAAREGLNTVLFYFVGYPQTTDRAVHLDWLMSPGDYFFEICSSQCYSSFNERATLIDFVPAQGWQGLPNDGPEHLEARIAVVPKAGGSGPEYNLLVTGTNEDYEAVVLSREKDMRKGIRLRPGEWTKWLVEDFEIDQGTVHGSVRFKLLELSKDGSKVALYRSQVYPLRGFSVPEDVSGELIELLGPYINEDAGHAYARSWIDWETLEQELAYQIDWIGKASRHLMDRSNASLYFIHWHLLDTLQHHCLGLIDPVGANYDPEKADAAWDEMRKGYALADRLVGELCKMADEETVVVVVSDHGNSPNRKRVSLVNLFLEKGWMVTTRDSEGRLIIDEAKSKVRINSLHIYVNLEGREPEGVVSSGQYEALRTEVVNALLSLRDPIDGEPAIALAVKKEDAGLMGMWGEGVGDVIFVYSPGHAWTGEEVLRLGEQRIIFRSGGANHGPQPPWTETEISSNYATLIMRGPGVREGKRREARDPAAKLADVAPTISHVLGIPAPRHSQGRVLFELLDEGLEVMKRPPNPDIDFPELPSAKGPPKFKGDVTDEV